MSNQWLSRKCMYSYVSTTYSPAYHPHRIYRHRIAIDLFPILHHARHHEHNVCISSGTSRTHQATIPVSNTKYTIATYATPPSISKNVCRTWIIGTFVQLSVYSEQWHKCLSAALIINNHTLSTPEEDGILLGISAAHSNIPPLRIAIYVALLALP